jgi:spore germination cell wall hydrolase CwlJ-like protein
MPHSPDIFDFIPRALGPRRPDRARRNGKLVLLGTVVVLFALAIFGAGFALYLIFEADGSQPRPHVVPAARSADRAQTAPPATPLPEPPANEFMAVARDTARAMNERIPFSTAPVPAASPVMLHLAGDDDARAIDCLAAAAWYEAGDSLTGQQAVIQVVLNRMRHAVFPKTVCGVVFEGSERRTGCQFSFTCDGSLHRIPSSAQWSRARGAAVVAMHGLVFAPVGYATHYHTNWVVPKWNATVDKVAQVETQLFYRWPGTMGQPRAFNGQHQGTEPVIAALAAISQAHRPAAMASASSLPTIAAPVVGRAPPPPGGAAQNDGRMTLIAVHASDFPGKLALAALAICRDTPARPCTVAGYLGEHGAIATDTLGHPRLPAESPDFYYFRDASRNREVALWNCTTFTRSDPAQCLPAGFAPLH